MSAKLMATQTNSSAGRINGSSDGSGARIGSKGLVLVLWDRFLYRIATLGFDLVILMVLALVLWASVLAMGGHIRLLQATVFLPLGIMIGALIIKMSTHRDNWREEGISTLRDWVPFLLIVFIYENLHDVAGQTMSWDIAGWLYDGDLFLFGVQPTIWAQKLFSPLLTDFMSISYALYFAEPLFLMFLLSLWGRRSDFRHMSLCLTLVFILGFIGYVFLPASPPRYFIEHLYTDPVRLSGLFLFDRMQGAWDGLSVISGGAFPSLHVGISSVALIYAYRFRKMNRTCKIVYYAYIPMVTSLWFSTVYLRHHWVIDIFAGWLVAAVGYVGAEYLLRVWQRLRQRYNIPL
jgi:membrane-associated phospholipid phosphatase